MEDENPCEPCKLREVIQSLCFLIWKMETIIVLASRISGVKELTHGKLLNQVSPIIRSAQ